MSNRYEAKAQERDTNPTPGVTSPSETNESNPNALMFSDSTDQAENFAEETTVKAWKLRKDM